MIGYFPTPYRDELFYGVVARFSDRMAFPTRIATLAALFGRTHAVATPDLPHGLRVLVERLPRGHPWSVDQIIDDHTTLPYHGPFLSNRTYRAVRELMASDEGSTVRTRCGTSTNRVRPPKFFRSCPLCDRADTEQYGEPYWHRLHQLPGVAVCPVHRLFLQPSSLRLDPLPHRHTFFSAAKATLSTTAEPLDPNDRQHAILLWLAQGTEWLLTQCQLNPGHDFIHRRYPELLASHGYVTEGGSIRMDDIREKALAHFTPELLELLQSPIPTSYPAGWLGDLLRKRHTAVAPLRHLLLLNFLGVTPEQFFYPDRHPAPTGTTARYAGPWPCRNPVCEHQNQLVIHERAVERIYKRGRDASILRCPTCGYTYGQYDLGGGTAPPDFIRDYGSVWHDRLRTMWLDLKVSVRQIALTLGVDSKTVKDHAEELSLPFPRQGKRVVTKTGLYRPKGLPPAAPLEQQRAVWLRLCATHPQAGVRALRLRDPATYAWLYRRDRDWLFRNRPARKRPVAKPVLLDWGRRDMELAPQVATAAAHIRNRLGKPCRVTITAIGRAIGRQSLFESHLRKLPLTRAVMKNVVESDEDFAIRRVQRAAERLRRGQGAFQRWELVRAAGLTRRIQVWPNVVRAIDDELRPFATVTIIPDGEPVSPDQLTG